MALYHCSKTRYSKCKGDWLWNFSLSARCPCVSQVIYSPVQTANLRLCCAMGGELYPLFSNEGQFSPKKDVNTMELYSRSEAAAMLGITVRKLDELRARRLIGYYQRCPGGKVQFSMAHLEKYLQRIEKSPRPVTKSR